MADELTATTSGRRRKIPLVTLASKAGVSVATASRVVSGSIPVSPELELKVRNAMTELGYHTTQSNSHGRKKGAVTVGYLTIDFAGAAFDNCRYDILRGVERSLREHKGHMMVAGYAEEMAADRLPLMVTQNMVSGLIIEADQFALKEWIYRIGQSLPTVLVMHTYPDRKLPSVMSDNSGSIYQAISYLRKLGHSKIGFLSVHDLGQPLCLHHEERRWAFMEMAPALGCEMIPEYVQIMDRDHSEEDLNSTIQRSLKAWLKLGDRRPTAIVSAAGIYAAAFCFEASKEGLEVPRDLSVIGFENTRRAEFYHPPLTCIADSLDEIGVSAVDLLYSSIKSHDASPKQVRVTSRLLERGSCRAI
jgi:DNA-binding LacI/PurR family transcriptional regulator